ncbi:large-conductance mechanosensitive channel protein MscL [candidate division GN15 bacterium]|nr:large-conductance mechanosensitive channel protein MscL [candidate division GN15 bacterium]
MLKEFREFIMRGNVLDLAVGIIIGAAFTAIVTSLVNDIIMPPVGLVTSGVDFSEIVITLQEASGEDPAVTINIGAFINALINFLIVALVVFFIVRWFNRLARAAKESETEESAPKPEPSTDELMLEELRAIRKYFHSNPPQPGTGS